MVNSKEALLRRGLGGEIFVDRFRQPDISNERVVGISAFGKRTGISEDIVRVDQGNDQEEWLLLRRGRGEELQHPFLAGGCGTVVIHEASVIVGVAAAHLVERLIGSSVGRIPSLESIWNEVFG